MTDQLKSLNERLMRVAMSGTVPSDDPHVIADTQQELDRLQKALTDVLMELVEYIAERRSRQ